MFESTIVVHLLIQSFDQFLHRIILRTLSLPSSRTLANDLQLVLLDALFRQSRLQSKPLHEIQDRVANLVRVRDVVSGSALSDVWQDACNLTGVLFARGRLDLDHMSEGEAAGDAVRDPVRRAESIAHCVAEAEAAFHVLAEEAQRGEGGEEKLRGCFVVVGVAFLGFREVGEEGCDGE